MADSQGSPAALSTERAQAPRPLERMKSFAPYVQGKSILPGRQKVIKLSSNEGCFGPSPSAIEAYRDAASGLHRYPDGSQRALREAIGRVHDVDPDRVVCGNGSEEVIGLLMRCFLGKSDELLLSQNHFGMCSIYGRGQGARIVLAPERDFTVDVDALLERITHRTRVISVANPNNPTGTYLSGEELERLVEGVPDDVLLILDGAYAEYVVREDFDDGKRWAENRPNVVVTRSFSKIYGLAGLRIGWGYGAGEVIEIVNRLRTPFNTNVPALAAATAAVSDQAHVAMSREHAARWQERIRISLRELGLSVVPSVTNFYLVDFRDSAGKTAVEAKEFLETNGVIPRPGTGEDFLRITIGTDAENEILLDLLKRYLKS